MSEAKVKAKEEIESYRAELEASFQQKKEQVPNEAIIMICRQRAQDLSRRFRILAQRPITRLRLLSNIEFGVVSL